MLEDPREANDPQTERAKELEEETGTDLESDPSTECDKVVLMEEPGSDLETAGTDQSTECKREAVDDLDFPGYGWETEANDPSTEYAKEMVEEVGNESLSKEPPSGMASCSPDYCDTYWSMFLGCEPCGARIWREVLQRLVSHD